MMSTRSGRGRTTLMTADDGAGHEAELQSG
jgi:hypothetical protein